VKRSTNTAPTFVKVHSLPPLVRTAVRNFQRDLRAQCRRDRALYGKIGCWGCLHTKDGAEGLCLEISCDFLTYLGEVGFDVSNEQLFLREYIFDPMGKEEALRQKFDDHLDSFPFDSDGCRFHFVVKVGELIIDWTARQFGEKNPFPAIWREI